MHKTAAAARRRLLEPREVTCALVRTLGEEDYREVARLVRALATGRGGPRSRLQQLPNDLALGAAGVGLWWVDLAARQVRHSGALNRLLGWAAGETLTPLDHPSLAALVVPADRARLQAAVEAAGRGAG